MDPKTEVVFHGFLHLANLEKLALVKAINDYFDSMDREPIRRSHDEEFAKLRAKDDFKCPCCGS